MNKRITRFLLTGMIGMLAAFPMTAAAEKSNIAMSNDLVDAFLEDEEEDGITISADLLGELNEEDYRENCETVDYSILFRHMRRMNGQPIKVNLTIAKKADGQFLAKRKENGEECNFLLIDELEEESMDPQKGDKVCVYGEFAGLVSVGEKDIPAIRIKYVDEAEVEETEEKKKETESQKTSSGQNSSMYKTLYCINCNEYITLRSYPSKSASALDRIPLGASVSYVGSSSNGFYEVIYNGTRGYALASYLGETNTSSYSSGNTGNYSTMYCVNCNEYITLRSYASTSASSLAHIPLGASVSYVSNAGNGFYEVIYNGTRGYALASYLSYSPSTKKSTGSSYSTMYVVNCNEYITLRSYASTSASSLAHIPLGASVSYVGSAGNGFSEVIYNGTRGYALSSYLSYSSSGTGNYGAESTMYVINCNESITLRTSASTSASEICQIPKGAAVIFRNRTENGFNYVEYNGYKGWALASYLG